jgi:quercetin dioxygenase-like cupin family protein
VVKRPPNVPHWHGASRDVELIQIAIADTENDATVWLERVTD